MCSRGESASSFCEERPSFPSGHTPIGELLRLDRKHVWHPYASMPASYDSIVVESAMGVNLKVKTSTGLTVDLVDGMSSWWAAIHGYNHPDLNHAVMDQLGRMSHVMFGGLTHEPAVRLATRLAHYSGLEHVFFADSGSVSVEVALKMAPLVQRAKKSRAKSNHASKETSKLERRFSP